MTKQSVFIQAVDLIFTQISAKHKFKTIWDIEKISSEDWQSWTDKITSLEEVKLSKLNTQLEALLKKLNVGDFWKVLVLSRKFIDIQEYIPALNFNEELNKRSLTVSEFVSHFSKWAKDDPELIQEYSNDALVAMIDNAIFKSEEDTLREIFSVVIYQGGTPIGSEEDIINNENTEQFNAIHEKYLNKSNYKDEIFLSLLFLICQLFSVNEQDLRDENDDPFEKGGISISKIITHLRSFM